MDLSDYQRKAHTTAMYPSIGELAVMGVVEQYGAAEIDPIHKFVESANPSNPYYSALGLAGEVGEYSNKLKKVMRDDGGKISQTFLDSVEGELGDILWYVAECATSLGFSLDAIAEQNIEKLFSRKERGKIQGEGDNR